MAVPERTLGKPRRQTLTDGQPAGAGL
ncbi:hypothetical protein Cabther_A0709 [Chloracidobacterium thermophilum B]|uniref:Uncharacterized protein n=1 Tax=Chloracidobacterium thermophilum (strain B) TaxID=981222 RepID=G2LGW6_CHLTF|nr:hypothetical protein Cabther_A0709 [Chloracidobacterium thermophilum B]